MHEEYREITRRPISKIIAPIRYTPFFSKPALAKDDATNQETELRPLTQGDPPPPELQTALEITPGKRSHRLEIQPGNIVSPMMASSLLFGQYVPAFSFPILVLS